MARKARLDLVGGTYWCRLRTHNREALLTNHAYCQHLLTLLSQYTYCGRIQPHCFLILPTEIHLLVTTLAQGELAKYMQHIGRSLARYINDQTNRSGSVFDGRYKSVLIQSDPYFLECMLFMDNLPRQLQLVLHASEYTWSSAKHYTGQANSTWLSMHPQYFNLGNTPFDREQAYQSRLQAFENSGSDRSATSLENRLSSTNPVLGDTQFITFLEKQLQVKLAPRPRGRPNKMAPQATT